MAQFIMLNKVTTGSANVPMIINYSQILSLQENVNGGGLTRVTLAGTPEYHFFTVESPAAISASVVAAFEMRSPGPYITSMALVSGELPLLHVNRIVNNDSTNLQPFYCNANFMLFAEPVRYLDIATKIEQTATMIVFNGASPTRFMSAASINEVATVLGVLTP